MALAAGQIIENGQVRDSDGRVVSRSVVGIADTLATSGSLTSPAAFTAVTFLAAPPPGVYQVVALITLTGTNAAELLNLRLRQNGITVVPFLPTLSGAGLIRMEFPRITVTGGNLNVETIGAGTPGSIYNVTLMATRIE